MKMYRTVVVVTLEEKQASGDTGYFCMEAKWLLEIDMVALFTHCGVTGPGYRIDYDIAHSGRIT